MDVFFFYETQGTNPVMAILADTLMSMEVVWVARHIPSGISAALRYQKKPPNSGRMTLQDTRGNTSLGNYWEEYVFNMAQTISNMSESEKPGNTSTKREKRELGRARAYASAEYLEWRNERRGDAIPVPMKVQHEDPSRALTDMAAQMEIMRAQMRLIEEREDRAMTEIESLRNQCKKKDELIERQRNECADANTQEETTKLRTEKEDLEVRGEEKDQVIEQLQEDLQQAQAEVQMVEQLQEELRQAQAEAESHKTLARDYSIELMKTKKNERLLEVQVKELKIERDYLQREIKKLEPVELQKDIWKVRAEHEQEQKRKLMQTCEKMAEVTQDHVANLDSTSS
ncbi:SUI1 domain [Sesbania bispinosa]|nr:SUI1 domain [Sesbania bispinosa]